MDLKQEVDEMWRYAVMFIAVLILGSCAPDQVKVDGPNDPQWQTDNKLRRALQPFYYTKYRLPADTKELLTAIPSLSKLIPVEVIDSFSWRVLDKDKMFPGVKTKLRWRGKTYSSEGALTLIRRGIDWELAAEGLNDAGDIALIDDACNAAVYVANHLRERALPPLGPIPTEFGPDPSKLDWGKYNLELVDGRGLPNKISIRSRGKIYMMPRERQSEERMSIVDAP